MGLPDNATLREFAHDVSWQTVEETRVQFQDFLNSLRDKRGSHPTSTRMIRHLTESYYGDEDEDNPDGDVLYAKGSRRYVLANLLGRRFRQGSWVDYVKPYNLNPAVYHENIHEAGGALKIRPVGVELESGVVRADGKEPTEKDLDNFGAAYIDIALKLGACLDIAPELCIYQAEVVVPAVTGYAKLLRHLEQNIAALTHAADSAGMYLMLLGTYPHETDFATSRSDKVETVAMFLNDVNESRPEQCDYMNTFRRRFQTTRGEARTANLLRFQGYHMHVDIAGRSEALGMLSYMLNLGSASAVANAAMLKGGPFMDGTCDPELLCVREYVRALSITGHYVGVPLSPHYNDEDMQKNAHLLRANLANGAARALLYGEEHGLPFSGMHNMLGRVRPDLGSSSRVCTLESTGNCSNPSAERLAVIATDFEISQIVVEHYFRQHGTDLDALYADKDMLDVFGPLDRQTFHDMITETDKHTSDAVIRTASGAEMTLVDFYEKKRRLLKRTLSPLNVIDTRDVDGLYDRLYHMLVAPNGAATTVDDFINHPTRRGTGNWGKILQNAYVEAGGTIGAKHPDAVHRVMGDLHNALLRRYAQ
jgi:hypothetical protein